MEGLNHSPNPQRKVGKLDKNGVFQALPDEYLKV